MNMKKTAIKKLVAKQAKPSPAAKPAPAAKTAANKAAKASMKMPKAKGC